MTDERFVKNLFPSRERQFPALIPYARFTSSSTVSYTLYSAAILLITLYNTPFPPVTKTINQHHGGHHNIFSNKFSVFFRFSYPSFDFRCIFYGSLMRNSSNLSSHASIVWPDTHHSCAPQNPFQPEVSPAWHHGLQRDPINYKRSRSRYCKIVSRVDFTIELRFTVLRGNTIQTVVIYIIIVCPSCIFTGIFARCRNYFNDACKLVTTFKTY